MVIIMITYFLFFLSFFVLTSKSKKISSTKFTLAQTRKKREKLSIVENLPQDLVSSILSRLPSKDLVKCKQVCKSWFDLITDPRFISNYYVVYNNLNNHSDGNNGQEIKNLLVIRRPFLSGLRTHISVILSSNTTVKKPKPKGNVVSSDLLIPPLEYNSDHKYWSEIMGPCNGIYFLEGNPNAMMNPSLRQFKALPESNFATSPHHGTYSFTSYAGFGFDPKTNDYKVVMMKDVWVRETDERRIGQWTAELYSLNSNCWRKLDASSSSLPLPLEIWGSSRVYTYINNCCHWWGSVDEFGKRKDVVLSFDMVNEVFRKIKVPSIRDSSKEAFTALVPFAESATVGVVVYPVRGKEKRYDVWMMKDYWDDGSWVKQYSVGPVEAICKIVGIYGSNQFLWGDRDEELVVCEADSQEAKGLHVYGKNDSLRAVRYMESLVSLHRGNEFRRQCGLCSLVPETLPVESKKMT